MSQCTYYDHEIFLHLIYLVKINQQMRDIDEHTYTVTKDWNVVTRIHTQLRINCKVCHSCCPVDTVCCQPLKNKGFENRAVGLGRVGEVGEGKGEAVEYPHGKGFQKYAYSVCLTNDEIRIRDTGVEK